VLWRIKPGNVNDYLFNVQNPEGTVKAVAESGEQRLDVQAPDHLAHGGGSKVTQDKTETSVHAWQPLPRPPLR
jgi:hypothetical protein